MSTIQDNTTPKQEPYELDDEILLSNVTLSIMDTYNTPDQEVDTPQEFDTPGSCTESQSPSSESNGTPCPEPASEKKPVKKRKSWGQELPTPTTNLPPRKRAKTDAEKEQRRIERVLRNRAAAQSSRERKRKEVEALEDQKNALADEKSSLVERNSHLEALNRQLTERVEAVFRQNEKLLLQMRQLQDRFLGPNKDNMSGIDPLTHSPPESLSHDISSPLFSDPSTPSPTSDGTLDPSHLSSPSKSNEAPPFDLTQHTAVMLCSQDLPCQSKTGPSLETEAMLAIMQWTLLLTTALSSQTPLLEVIFYLVTKQPIPNSELTRLFPWIHLLISIKPTQRLRRRLLTISPVCALLLDATASGRWFECPTDVLNLVRSGFYNGLKEQDENPASACRKFVMEFNGRGGIDYGPGKGDNIFSGRRQHGYTGSDFSTLLSKV